MTEKAINIGKPHWCSRPRCGFLVALKQRRRLGERIESAATEARVPHIVGGRMAETERGQHLSHFGLGGEFGGLGGYKDPARVAACLVRAGTGTRLVHIGLARPEARTPSGLQL